MLVVGSECDAGTHINEALHQWQLRLATRSSFLFGRFFDSLNAHLVKYYDI